MKPHELTAMYKKSAEKADGVYGYIGMYWYVVKDGRLMFVGDRYTGEIFQQSHGFNVSLGKVETYKLKKHLISLL